MKIERPLFLCDWERAVFIHYEMDPDQLQPIIPFELDLYGGKAYVSLVAFTQSRPRPSVGGFATAWLSMSVASHPFFNLRTYVHCGDEVGIYFIAEWVPNFFSILIAPRVFGLPYRLGWLDYHHSHESGNVQGKVFAGGGFSYEARFESSASFEACEPGGLDEFFIERYTGFTQCGRKRRFFRIWHEPWPQVSAQLTIRNDRLLRSTFPWFQEAQFVGANYSPGVTDIRIGRPRDIFSLSQKRKS